MVQRKVPGELDIKANHGKSFKLSANLKPSSPRHHDAKGRGGTDLKKKMSTMMIVMKKSGSIERPDHDGFRLPTSLRKVRKKPGKARPHQLVVAATGELPQKKQSYARAPEPLPNYMKSTSSSDARVGRLQVRLPLFQGEWKDDPKRSLQVYKTPGKSLRKETTSASFDRRASRMPLRMSSMKLPRTLTKTPIFKPTRLAKRYPLAILCHGIEVQRPTCSSTLKDSKFPNYLELNPGGTELEGTSILKVCPYMYCSLNGHRHALLPPLKTFLMAKRRSLKAQKGFKLDCSSPRGIKPSQDSTKETNAKLASSSSRQDENANVFIEIYSKDDGSKQQVNVRDAVVRETIGSENSDYRLDAIAISIEVETAEFLLDDLVEEVPETVSLGITANDVSDSETNDMEWEEAGKGSASCFYDVQLLESLETNGFTIQEENLCLDHTSKSSLEEIVASEVQQNLYDEESLNSEAWSENGESNRDESQKYTERIDPLTVSPMCNAFEADDNMGTKSMQDTTEDIDEGANATVDENQFAIPEATNEIQGTATKRDDDKEHASDNHKEYGYPIEDYVFGSLNSQGFKTSNNFPKQGPDVSDKDQAASHSTQVRRFKVVPEGNLSNEYIYGDSVPKTRNLETNQASLERSLLNSAARDDIEADKYDAAESLIPGLSELDQDTANEDNKEGNAAPLATGSGLQNFFFDEDLSCNTRSDTMNKQFENIDFKCRDTPEKDPDNTEQGILPTEKGYEDQPKEQLAISDSNNKRNLLVHTSSDHVEELISSCKKLRGTVKNKKRTEELEDLREFNPREPNYLPREADPERQRVDLKHQMIDDRKNAEEWMMDFALRQTVNKLASARKRKVALLIEAFEKVTPVPKYEAHLRHTSEAFAHVRPMQACS